MTLFLSTVAPETEVEESAVSLPFSGQLRLTCQVKIKSPDTIVWQIDGTDIDPDDRRSVSLIKMSDYVYNLQLLIGQMRKEDFGQYACFAQDRWGASLSSVQVAGKICHIWSCVHCTCGVCGQNCLPVRFSPVYMRCVCTVVYLSVQNWYGVKLNLLYMWCICTKLFTCTIKLMCVSVTFVNTEEVSSGDHCQLGNIPVMPNFNVQQVGWSSCYVPLCICACTRKSVCVCVCVCVYTFI